MTALRETLLAAGDRVLLREISGAAASGGELVANVDALAGALRERGLTGARVGLWHSNSIAAIEALLAVEWLGGTRIPIDPNATGAEAMATWEAAGAAAWIADREHVGQLDERALVHDNDQRLAGPACPAIDGVDLEATAVLYPRAVQGGRLIAIPISYRNWAATMRLNQQSYEDGTYGADFDPDTEVFLTAQQIMHGTGPMGTWPFLHMGLPQVIVRRYSDAQVLAAIQHEGVTATAMPTLMVSRFAKAVESSAGGTGSLRRMIYGGAPVAAEELRHSCEVFPRILIQVYGRVEGGFPVTALSPADHDRIAAGDTELASSCGRPLPAVGEVMIRPSGEVAVRSSMTVAEFTDPDGWCGLGDIGEIRDGYLYLHGRLDRQINTGYHVYPGEVEDALRALPTVSAAFVCGEPDERYGERIAAYVVIAEAADGPTDSEAIIKTLDTALRARLAAYKVPRAYHLVSELPEQGATS